ncbi:MAG: 4-hydroxythreonine-4-phosphate dehydrogenase PdxA [bacterium]
MTKRIIITLGDPLGIGPEIILKTLKQTKPKTDLHYDLVGLNQLFSPASSFTALKKRKDITWHTLKTKATVFRALAQQKDRTRQTLATKKACGRIAYEALNLAVSLLKENPTAAIVTAPISKENITAAGFAFPGHTEFFCHAFHVNDHAMMLFNNKLRVVLSTIHIPLAHVSQKITQKLISQKILLTAQSLSLLFNIKKPRIAICGLNPHAGENNLLGKEEKNIIEPAIKALKNHPALVRTALFGPLPADTIFQTALEGKFDAVLCHYHDQGLIPIKLTGLSQCVNITLGLPFVRTSPGHGTAFDIAGKNKADPRSFQAALKAAVDFIRHS